jgi:hypothetical protein
MTGGPVRGDGASGESRAERCRRADDDGQGSGEPSADTGSPESDRATDRPFDHRGGGARERDAECGPGVREPDPRAHNHYRDDHFGEFTEELRLLAETVLEWIEPVLRRTGADGRAGWSGCSWCPVCAAAALVRGEHHDVIAAIADHGTTIVTVLREALAGVPMEPVRPPGFDGEDPVPQDDSQFPGDAAPGREKVGAGGASRYVSIPVRIKT